MQIYHRIYISFCKLQSGRPHFSLRSVSAAGLSVIRERTHSESQSSENLEIFGGRAKRARKKLRQTAAEGGQNSLIIGQ